ncbi:hypothetical protein [Pseudogemmobacter humi]|uniref:Uncharacterized protein n=1 Tax=Pseudogemmobacter humi TaxID=2483812 RepID=A0A3P5X9V5_9RHOB|nr:hypothetical protein [Pseudogemmobacter humi]VDC25217.1 hypothetical protein XINFAN_01455 [Pseudogemmobacter humi]
MNDITVKALYASVVEDEGHIFIGFAEGEGEEDPYALFRQPLGGGPVWFEVSDESLGAEDAVESVTLSDKGLEIVIAAAKAAKVGWARSIAVRIGPQTESADEALAALREMLGDRFRG